MKDSAGPVSESLFITESMRGIHMLIVIHLEKHEGPKEMVGHRARRKVSCSDAQSPKLGTDLG